MSEVGHKLLKAPIIEAVLDIGCDLPPGLEFEALGEAGREKLREIYPKFRRQIVHEQEIVQTGKSSTEVKTRFGPADAFWSGHVPVFGGRREGVGSIPP
jgi:hypothetical protein